MGKILIQSQILRRVLTPSLFLVILLQAITQYHSLDSQLSPSQLEKTSSKDLLSNAVEALGGLKAIQDVKTQVIVAEGKRYEPGQKYEPLEQPLLVSNFGYNLTQDLISDGLRMNWHRDIAYPYPNNLDYSIVIANNTGYTKGKDGLFSPEEAPMRQSAIDAILKELLITSPLLLMQNAVKNPAIVQVQTDQMFRGLPNHVVAFHLKENMPPIRLFLDNSTFLPTKVETIEDDPIHGDVLIEVFFDDWQEVKRVMFPFLVTYELHDEVTEERRSYVDITNEAFTIPPNNRIVSDIEKDPFRGWLASQWYLRMHAFGIPHYDINHYVNFTEMSPGIYHVTGSTHHSLVVEMNDYMVVVETPLYEERSQAVIDEISKRWPDKPIKYVVATHAHDDHIGGLRAYAAENATIIGSRAALPEIEHILNSSHNIRPDSFQTSSPDQVRIDTVAPDGKMTINDGNRSIDIYPVNNSHSDDMLAVYLPTEKIMLASDLYSPGGTPEPFKKYSKELLEFVSDNRIDVNIIVGTHGIGGGGPIEDLHDFVNLK